MNNMCWIHFTSDSLSVMPCHFLIYDQSVPYIVVEASLYFFYLLPQGHYMYSLLLIGIYVVATTYHKGQMISLTSKPQSGSIIWEICLSTT